MTAPGASATCVDASTTQVCVPGSVQLSDPGSGVACVYLKTTPGKPYGWDNPDNGAPYIWTESQAWGFEHAYPDEWTYRVCSLCTVTIGGALHCSVNPLGPWIGGHLSSAAAACATGTCSTRSGDQLDRIDPGDGVLCAYAKLDDPPPDGHDFGSGGAPYIWFDTQAWGDRHPGQFDYQFCLPA
jgi:hypothetical protein